MHDLPLLLLHRTGQERAVVEVGVVVVVVVKMKMIYYCYCYCCYYNYYSLGFQDARDGNHKKDVV